MAHPLFELIPCYNICMKAKEIIISLNQDEFDTLGQALEDYLRSEITNYPSHFDLIQDEIAMLHDFVLLGYRLSIKTEDPFDIEILSDAYEWAERIKPVDKKPTRRKK